MSKKTSAGLQNSGTTDELSTEDGETLHEYEVGGVSYPSAEAIEAALKAR